MFKIGGRLTGVGGQGEHTGDQGPQHMRIHMRWKKLQPNTFPLIAKSERAVGRFCPSASSSSTLESLATVLTVVLRERGKHEVGPAAGRFWASLRVRVVH